MKIQTLVSVGVVAFTPHLFSAPFATVNLIKNSGFERATNHNHMPVGWNEGGYGNNTRTFIYPAPGYKSARSAKLVVSNYTDGDAKWYFDDIPVIGGTSYRYSDWYTSTADANITLRFLLDDGSYSYAGIILPPASSSWAVATADFTAPMNAVSMTVFHALATSGSLTIDSVSLNKLFTTTALPQGMISLDFDDGWKESATHALSTLRRYGYHGTFNIIPSRVGMKDMADSGYSVLTTNDIRALYRAGNEIGGYTLSHSDLTTLDLNSVREEVREGRNVLLSWHVGPILSFVYPFGAYNDSIERVVQQAGFQSAYTTDPGEIVKSNSLNPYELGRFSVRSTTALSEITNAIDAALSNKMWLILEFHHVDLTSTDYSVSPTFLEQVVKHLHSKHAKVVTATEGYQLLTR